MTKEEAIEWLKSLNYCDGEETQEVAQAIDEAIKTLEQQKPLEKFENVKDHICKLADDYKCWDNRLSHEESLELCNILKQQSDDCVSRASVKELFQEGCVMGMYDFLGIDDLPPVTPTQRWIPVSERLPEEDGEYLLYGKIDEDEENYIFIGEYDSCGEQFGIWQEQFDRTTLGCLGSEFFDYSSVIAWQPLPKPYEEKRGNENGSN